MASVRKVLVVLCTYYMSVHAMDDDRKRTEIVVPEATKQLQGMIQFYIHQFANKTFFCSNVF